MTVIVPKYSYVIQPRLLQTDGSVLSVDYMILSEWDNGEPTISGMIDWQDGLYIWHTELVEPSHWPSISEQIKLMIEEAKTMIGDNWAND